MFDERRSDAFIEMANKSSVAGMATLATLADMQIIGRSLRRVNLAVR